MNPKRYETLRVIVRDHARGNPAWAACGELLAELDRVRAASARLVRDVYHRHYVNLMISTECVDPSDVAYHAGAAAAGDQAVKQAIELGLATEDDCND